MVRFTDTKPSIRRRAKATQKIGSLFFYIGLTIETAVLCSPELAIVSFSAPMSARLARKKICVLISVVVSVIDIATEVHA